MALVDVKSLSRDQLEAFASQLGQPAFRGRQLFQWLYQKGATDFDAMTNLPAGFRKTLREEASISALEEANRQQSKDGTLKFLFKLSTGRHIESVLIPDFDEEGNAKRLTVCVSSQVGCAMGCTFCATGQMGFQQNLTVGEIFDQVWRLDQVAREHFGRPVTNVVFMGMGEPLLNYTNVLNAVRDLTHEDGLGLAPKRITISTVGLARRIQQLADEHFGFHLAVSLHAPTDGKRSAIMPVNRNEQTDLKALRESIQYYTKKTGQMVTYEYCMFDGYNDTQDDAKALGRVAGWAPCKINLIMYNPVDGLGFSRSAEDQLNAFIQILVKKGARVTVRRSRGQDIDAACGQLAVQA